MKIRLLSKIFEKFVFGDSCVIVLVCDFCNINNSKKKGFKVKQIPILVITFSLLFTACSSDQNQKRKELERKIKLEDNKTMIYKSCMERNVSKFQKTAYNFKEFLTGDPSCDVNESKILHYADILDKQCQELGCFDVNTSSIEEKINNLIDFIKEDYEKFKKRQENK